MAANLTSSPADDLCNAVIYRLALLPIHRFTNRAHDKNCKKSHDTHDQPPVHARLPERADAGLVRVGDARQRDAPIRSNALMRSWADMLGYAAKQDFLVRYIEPFFC